MEGRTGVGGGGWSLAEMLTAYCQGKVGGCGQQLGRSGAVGPVMPCLTGFSVEETRGVVGASVLYRTATVAEVQLTP